MILGRNLKHLLEIVFDNIFGEKFRENDSWA